MKPDDERISGYLLSNSPEEIMTFFELSQSAWRNGFKTQDEIFEWLKKSCLYNAPQLVAADAHNTRKSDQTLREMYYAFIKAAATEKQTHQALGPDEVRERALRTFGKKEHYDALVHKNRLDRVRREKYNGVKVMSWTKLDGVVIRDIMSKVRDHVGERGLIESSEDALKSITLQVAKEMHVKSKVRKV